MTKVLILNVGYSNKGNLALVVSTIKAIKKYIPEAEFVLVGPEKIEKDNFYVKKQMDSNLSIRRPFTTINSIFLLIYCGMIYVFRKFGIHSHINKKSKLFDYNNCDIVIHSGGDQMSGELGIGVLSEYLHLSFAILLEKPVILYGESLGFFKNSILNLLTRLIFNKTKLILVREELSKTYLDNNYINNPDVYVTADPAFCLDSIPQELALEILFKEDVYEINRPLIGINANGLFSRFVEGDSKIEADEKISEILAKVSDNLIENLNATIIFIPHVYSNFDDDRKIIKVISHKIKNDSKIISICNEYTPQELKGIIGLCDLFIGARMHATIASTSMCIPTVGIAYSHKMHGIIGKMLGQEKYIIDINELNYNDLKLKIIDAWENREQIKTELKYRIPLIKEKAMLNGKLVKDMLDSLGNYR